MSEPLDDPLTIAGQSFASHLLIGSSNFPNNQVMLDSVEASGAEIVTVAIRRIDLGGGGENILDLLE
ncbi:MAG TPA: thiazole synthase, partial [Rhodospirillaceae bacterium]|nr:thiazole synthase [Rhodospirillaceae bacterium]